MASFGSIRPWAAEDAPALLKYANNRKIWLNLRDSFPFPYTAENADDFLASVARQEPTTFFAIATTTEAIGSIALTINQDVHRFSAEIGYWLAEPYWRRGIMTEAVDAICEYTFDRFGVVRVYAEPYARNTNSCNVLVKAGFSLEGRLRSSVFKDGQWLDQLIYARVSQRHALQA
jgi:RimJ/RimL family protein N-acetyltransferase